MSCIADKSTPRPAATRRHAEVLMAAIRVATRAELAQFGYAGVTFEGVARRARTSKPVLYRRYRSRAHMVFDALPDLQWQPDRITSSRTLREELMIVFGSVVDKFLAIGIENYRSLIGEADEDLLDMLNTYVADLAEKTVYPALQRARARGEIGPADIPFRAATSIGVLLRNEFVFTHTRVDGDTLAELLDTVYLPLIRAVAERQVTHAGGQSRSDTNETKRRTS